MGTGVDISGQAAAKGRSVPLPGLPVGGGKGQGELLDGIIEDCRRFGDRPALSIPQGERLFTLSYRELESELHRVAAILRDRGVDKGVRVALLSESRPEWVTAFFGTLSAGATVIPLDPKLTVEELSAQVGHSRPRVLLASKACAESARQVAERVAGVEVLLTQDADAGLPSLAALRPSRPFAPLYRGPDEIAMVIYTSGTTGQSKGVELTLDTLHFERVAMDHSIGPQPDERFLSILPLHHTYELVCGCLTLLRRGASICYSESLLPDELTKLMREQRITSLIGVPLVFKALERGIERQVQRRGKMTQAWFAATRVLAQALPYAVRRKLFSPVLGKLGPNLRAFYSGGAALPPSTARFFLDLGLPIYQGYGLSETGPVIATNNARANRIGSVGKPLTGVEVRIVNGEIWTRGRNVMRGYLDRPDLTDEAFAPGDGGGWLRTGDLGHLDEDGYLWVTGRAKELIVLGGGKKVHPDEVEELLSQSPELKEVCVLGTRSRSVHAEGFEEVCAVVVPADHLERDQAKSIIETEFQRLGAQIAAFKRPTRIEVRWEMLPRTTTRKLQRRLIASLLEESK